LLKRAFTEDTARKAALRELDAASEVARRFCDEWNETRLDAGAAAKYEALETELEEASLAAVPAMFRILTVPPAVAFSGPEDAQPADARQQVRAIFGLATVLKLESALPFFVVHAGGPSLTLSSNAASAVQRFSGEHFGAGFLVVGDEAALLAWWKEHRLKHRVVLDHLNHTMLQWARSALERSPPRGPRDASCAVWSLHRAAGEDRKLPGGVDDDALRIAVRDRLEEIEAAWVLPPR
jgi:hypothetical protein